MQSLQHELKKLDLSPPSQGRDRSKSPESSVENAPAAESMSPLDNFIRDLDERKGKLPCCQEYVQEITDIQASVENFLKSLLLDIEKDFPFFKTTLINSGSFYEGTKVGKPDEFDYFVQMDNLSQDIRFEELKHGMVAVIPSESAFEKLPKVNRSHYSFDWKVNIKSPFVEALDSKLVKGFKAFGLKVLSDEMGSLQRHGPAYTLNLKWIGGKQYKGLIIAVDLVLAVKINTHSSTMKVDFESQAGRVVSSLLGTLPNYFAVSGYKEYPVSSSSHLFKKFKEEQKERVLRFPISEPKISLRESHCLLRCSQSCLEQSLFRDHFGPDGGPSVCLRVLKVLRDMTRPFDQYELCFSQYNLVSGKSIEEKVWEFVNTGKEINSDWHRKMHSLCSATEPESTTFISSYTLKTLVLFEWIKYPEEKQWTGNNLSQRIVNIVTALLRTLEQNKGIRSFWYKDYNVLPNRVKKGYLPAAINRVTIILKCLSSLQTASQNCSFEDFVQTLTNLLTLARRKTKLTRFLHRALRDIFDDKITKVLEESVGKTKKPEESSPIPKGPYWMTLMNHDWDETVDTDFMSASSVFCSIYIQALLEKLAPVEDFHILSSYFKEKDDSISVSGTDSFTKEEAEEIVKSAREIFEENARKTMNDLGNILDYSLWSRDFKYDEVASLLKLLHKNFEKDIELMRNKIKAVKASRKTGIGE